MKTSIKNTLDLIVSNQSNNLSADWDTVLYSLELEPYDEEVNNAYQLALNTFPYSGQLRASYIKKLSTAPLTTEELDTALAESITLFPHDPFILSAYLDVIRIKYEKNLITKKIVNDTFRLVISGDEPESTQFYGGLIAYPNCAAQIEFYLKFLESLSDSDIVEIFGPESFKEQVIRSFFHYVLSKPIHQLDGIIDRYKEFEKREGDINQVELISKRFNAALKVEEWRTQLWRRAPLSRLTFPLNEKNAVIEGNAVKSWLDVLAFEEGHKASFTPIEHKRNLVFIVNLALTACPYHPLIYNHCYELFLRSELVDEAMKILQLGASRNPKNALIHFLYADALEQSKPVEAAAVYQDLISYTLEAGEPISNILAQYVRFCSRVDGAATNFNPEDRQRKKKKVFVHSVEAIYEWAREKQYLDDPLVYSICNALEDKYGAKKTYDIVFKPLFAATKDKPSGYLVAMAYELATKISPNDAQQLITQLSKFLSEQNATSMAIALARRYGHVKAFQEVTDSIFSSIESSVELHSSMLDCCLPQWLYNNIQTNTEAEQRKITTGIWSGLQIKDLESYIVAKQTAPVNLDALQSTSIEEYERNEAKSELPGNLFLLLNTIPALPPQAPKIDVDGFLHKLTESALPPLPGTKLNLTVTKQRK